MSSLHLPDFTRVAEDVVMSLLSVCVCISFEVSRTAVTIHETTIWKRCLVFTGTVGNQIRAIRDDHINIIQF